MRALLAHLGVAMVAAGQTVSDIEDELMAVSAQLGYPDLQIAAAPTGVTLTLASGQPATYEAVNGSLRLDQAVAVRSLRYRLMRDDVSVEEATAQLLSLRAQPPRYPAWMANLGWIGTAVGIALILQPAWPNVTFAAVGAVITLGFFRVSQRFSVIATLLPAVAAFTLSCLAFAASNAGLLEGPLRTLLAPMAVLLPGALIVTAMSELASGDMVAGSARLIFGVVQLLLFTLGVVAASRLFSVPMAQVANIRVDELGWWAAPLGLMVITGAIAVLEGPPLRLLPWIAVVLGFAFGAQTVGQQWGSAALGSFLGALAASLGAYAVEAIKPSLPRLVVFLPAFWLLVPGSLGLLSTTQLAVSPGNALGATVEVFAVIAAIALGLLIGSAIAQSVRGAIRSTRRRRS